MTFRKTVQTWKAASIGGSTLPSLNVCFCPNKKTPAEFDCKQLFIFCKHKYFVKGGEKWAITFGIKYNNMTTIWIGSGNSNFYQRE